MLVQRFDSLTSLQTYCQRWEELADDCVFRSWTWLTTWWEHYGGDMPDRQLCVLLVFDQPADCHTRPLKRSCTENHESVAPHPDQLVAILPTYVERNRARGQVLRLLGDGEVCSDHLDLLTDPAHAQQATQAMAEYLCQSAELWDVADFSGVDAQSKNLQELASQLTSEGCDLRRQAGPSCWSIELPETWDKFLALQSKSHRKQLRRLERQVLQSDQAIWHRVESQNDFPAAWDILVDLHQRRRQRLGEPGCFASDRFSKFHRDVAGKLLEAGQLELAWLELGGQPIAAEYHLAVGKTVWAYQGGLDPDRLDEEPGRLSMICFLQQAIANGCRQLDLLRGDEPYKAHWRATPQDTFELQIVPPRSSARWRYRTWTLFRQAGRWARQFTNLLS